MRFLFVMLTTIWLGFGWVCFDALRWQPPLPRPWHVEDALEKINSEDIETEIHQTTLILDAESMTNLERAHVYYRRGWAYWLKTHLQDSRVAQKASLNLALRDFLSALKLVPNHHVYLFFIADVYHQLENYDEAQKYYEKTLEAHPGYPIAIRRFQEMQEETGQSEEDV